jgi:NADPH:quinone reductase-like Zn-dependent oxidoreductase
MRQTVIRLDKERTSFGGLKAYSEDVPKPSKHEVLMKVVAVSLNYRDIAIATSKYPFPVKDNVVPCSDAAGIVVEVGEGVNSVAVGDHIIGTLDFSNLFGQQMSWSGGQGGPVDGVLREYLAIPAASAVIVPKNSPQSFAEWSTLVVTGVTAWNSLYGNTPLRPGQVVLFQGKNSSKYPKEH